MVRFALLGLPFGIAVIAAAPMAAAHASTDIDDVLARRVIVEWAPDTTSADRAQTRREVSATDVVSLGRRFQTLTLPDSQDPAEALATLRDDPGVIAAEPDSLRELQATPNDPDLGLQWPLANTGQSVLGVTGTAGVDVDALAAWDMTKGDSDVLVAIIDSGYRFNHPDLKNRFWVNAADPVDGKDNDSNGLVDDYRGWDFSGYDVDANPLQPDNDPTEDLAFTPGHGVHVAGIVAASGDDGVGITGVSQKATVMPLRVCGWSTISGKGSCPTSATIAAVNYAGKHGVDVANLSLAGGTYSQIERDAFAANPGTLYVMSAGNDAKDVDSNPVYPCAYNPATSGISGAIDNVVCVAATNNKDEVADFSNWGAKSVDLAAPGQAVYSSLTLRDFYTNDFGGFAPLLGWTNNGWILSDAPPHTSMGIANDTATQKQGSSRRIVTPPLHVTAPSVCTAYWYARVSITNGDVYTGEILVNGASLDTLSYSGLQSWSGWQWVGSKVYGAGSKDVSFAFTFKRGANSGPAAGAWLDDVRVTCQVASGQENSTSYGHLSGTSMAAPMVTGTAALLRAYEPKATVAQMRSALLTSGEELAPLDPVTGSRPVSTGRRLNAEKALKAVDALVPPEVTVISDGPDATSDSATFTFDSPKTRTPVTFRCALDGATARACTSPYTIHDVPAGWHTMRIRAVDNSTAHNQGPQGSWTWNSPGPPPDTTLVSGPAPIGTETGAVFAFSSPNPGVTFECAVGRAAYAACTSPKSAGPFAVGTHSFAVRAVDSLGRPDSSPAQMNWDVLSQSPPETVIDSGPEPSGTARDATLKFSSPSFKVWFECSLDGAAFSACTSPVSLTGLALGAHRFEVRGVDGLDRRDPSAARLDWTVESVPVVAQPPASVGGIKVVRKRKSAVLTWSAVAGATGYRVTKGGKVGSVAVPRAVVRGLKPRRAYRVTIAAVNDAGVSPGTVVKIKKKKR